MSSVVVREGDVQLSNNERDFIVKVQRPVGNLSPRAIIVHIHSLQALLEEVRIDGRRPLDYRKVTFEYTLDDSSCIVLLGQTRVLSVVTASLEAPYPDR